jgi:hypothetical protein
MRRHLRPHRYWLRKLELSTLIRSASFLILLGEEDARTQATEQNGRLLHNLSPSSFGE